MIFFNQGISQPVFSEVGGGRGVPSVKVASTFQPSSHAPLSLIEERGREKDDLRRP